MIEEAHLTGTIAVMAGLSPELAEATARRFATHGAAGLMICGRGAERGQAVAAIVSAAGCPTHFLPADLARIQDCAAVITEVEQVFGRIDLLVTGGGDAPSAAAGDVSAEQFDHRVAADLRAPFLLMQGAAGLMRRRGIDGTMVVTIGSVSGEVLPAPLSCACEGALASMTWGFANSLLPHGIRVLGLALGQRIKEDEAPPTPSAVAWAIATLAAAGNPTAPGSIVDFAALRRPETAPA